MSFDPVDNQFLNTLESSGITDAYEYVIRKLIEDNFPRNQVYEKCARYLLEYQKLLLESNIKAKNAQLFFKLSNIEEEKKKEVKAKDIIPTFPITLRSRLLFEQEENRPPPKIFETNIDELMKNKLNLLSKNSLNEQARSNLKGYGSYAAYVENENEKLRMYNFKINTKFSCFKFIPMEEIEKGNYPNEKINYINSDDNNINDNNINDNNINNNYINDNNSNVNLNSDADFIMPSGGERLNTKSSRKSTTKSKKTESESVSSKKSTPSQRAAIQKVSKEMVDELMKK